MTPEQIAAQSEKEKRLFILNMIGRNRHKEALQDAEVILKEYDDLWSAWNAMFALLDERGYSPWNQELNEAIYKS